jgi:hypothetical protein
MVTFALFAMMGLIGLAVDFGWAFFVKRAAQTAADAAALAAVKHVMVPTPDFRCTGGLVTCASAPQACPATGNLVEACNYAAQNGFSTANARQNVTVQASDRTTPPTIAGCGVNHPPTAQCVDVEYWVTVRVSESVPQLFSAIFSHTNALVAARATAGVAQSAVTGSVIVLNREGDDVGHTIPAGSNVVLNGTGTLTSSGGIVLASASDQAGLIQGTATVTTPFTQVREGGAVDAGASPGGWPFSNVPDGSRFNDPMRDKDQPALNPNQHTLPYIAVPGGNLTGLICPGNICPPGNYYATTVRNVGGVNTTFASGQPLQIPDGAAFSFAGGSFGDFVFFGGLRVGAAAIDFGPGRYVMAGVLVENDPVFETTLNTLLTGGTSETSDAGRVFILTDSSYGGKLDTTVGGMPTTRDWPTLPYGRAIIRSGDRDGTHTALYGLNPLDASLPENLKSFGPVLIWQDQLNAYPDRAGFESPGLVLQTSAPATFGGVIYQPKGAWTEIQTGSDYSGPLRFVTGALLLQGNARLTLNHPAIALTRMTAALVE